MPTMTFEIATTADEGTAVKRGADYPPAGEVEEKFVFTPPAVAAEKTFSSPNHRLSVAFLRWDTSSIPEDAEIHSAFARFRVFLVSSGGDGRSLTAEWYDAETISMDDWTSTVGTDAHAGSTLALLALHQAEDNVIDLTNLANINKTGYTGLRLHITGDAPTVTNYIFIQAIDSLGPGVETFRSQLHVNYTIAGVHPDFGRHTNPKLRKRARELRSR